MAVCSRSRGRRSAKAEHAVDVTAHVACAHKQPEGFNLEGVCYARSLDADCAGKACFTTCTAAEVHVS